MPIDKFILIYWYKVEEHCHEPQGENKNTKKYSCSDRMVCLDVVRMVEKKKRD